MTRPTWSYTMFAHALTWAARGTCPRLQVGCVFVDAAWQVRSSGYNGAPRKLPHCIDVGCLMVDGHCQRSIHAEANGILTAARLGISLYGTRVFLTHRPCQVCAKLLVQVGVTAVDFLEPYSTDAQADQVETMLAAAGIPLRGPHQEQAS